MSLKSELVDLLDSAEKKLHDAEALAVSERNRLLEGFAHARSAVHSSVLSDEPVKPVAAPKAAVKS